MIRPRTRKCSPFARPARNLTFSIWKDARSTPPVSHVPCALGQYWARLSRVYFANADADASKIGFDDSQIYRELAQPHSRRKVPMIQMMREEALAAFRAWENKPNKIA